MENVRFRLWDVAEGRMYDRVYAGHKIDEESALRHLAWDGDYWKGIHPDTSTIMPFIHREDKNGKPIFELDIVRYRTGDTEWDYEVGVIEWYPEESRFSYSTASIKHEFYLQQMESKDMEVIGNLFEGVGKEYAL